MRSGSATTTSSTNPEAAVSLVSSLAPTSGGTVCLGCACPTAIPAAVTTTKLRPRADTMADSCHDPIRIARAGFDAEIARRSTAFAGPDIDHPHRGRGAEIGRVHGAV